MAHALIAPADNRPRSREVKWLAPLLVGIASFVIVVILTVDQHPGL